MNLAPSKGLIRVVAPVIGLQDAFLLCDIAFDPLCIRIASLDIGLLLLYTFNHLAIP